MSREVHVRFCESRGVRFPPATHLVVMVSGTRDHVRALREEVAAVLAPMGLRLSPSKTRIVHMSDGFDFLGFRIRWQRKKGTRDQWRACTFIADRPVRSLKDNIRALTQDVPARPEGSADPGQPDHARLGCLLPARRR